MVPAEHEPQILQTGIHFMRAITEAYGSEEGMRLWDNIVSTLDPDIKGKIFVALLLGEYNNQLSIYLDLANYHVNVPRVEGIKAIRMASGLGLKEAKDIHDKLVLGSVEKIPVEPAHRLAAIRNLAGVHILAR